MIRPGRLLVLALLLGLVITPLVHAAGVDGQYCWQLQDAGGTPLIDQLRVMVTTITVPGTIPASYHLDVDWTALPFYQVLGNGLVTSPIVAPVAPNTLAFAVTGSQDTAAFSGNHLVSLNATINLPSLNGTWDLQAPGTLTFKNNGKLGFLLSCAIPAPASVDALGQPRMAGYHYDQNGEPIIEGQGEP